MSSTIKDSGEFRDISVAEFFRKNIHLLGFDNPSRALLTTIREAVDNSLDACEEGGILPELKIELKKQGTMDSTNGVPYIVIIEDNGPGIPHSHVGRIFGKLLYGSKFHRLRQSRGQQGIGISASVLYAQLSCDNPTDIWVWEKPGPATHYQIKLDVKHNEPIILVKEKDDSIIRDHTGVRIRFRILGRYYRGDRSVDTYLRQVGLANPELSLTFINGETGETTQLNRSTTRIAKPPKEIKPHPHGVDLGFFAELLLQSRKQTVKEALVKELSRVTSAKASALLRRAKIKGTIHPSKLEPQKIKTLFDILQGAKFVAPRGDCLSPIGSTLLETSLKAEINADFYHTVTRSTRCYRGNPFTIEVGLAYGGDLPCDSPIRVIRVANKVPLIYNPTGGAVMEALSDIDWKSYGLLPIERSCLTYRPLFVADTHG